MAEPASKLPLNKNEPQQQQPQKAEPNEGLAWHPFESLRREMDRVFQDFDWRNPLARTGFDLEPLRRELSMKQLPVVDVAETDNAYEITAEMPGMDEKNVEVKIANGMLCIRGEKKDEREERHRDYFVSERRFGSFERRLRVPPGVDTSRIDASFKNGVLLVMLPKSAEAQSAERTIAVKSG
jgi:HSP20 family protein